LLYGKLGFKLQIQLKLSQHKTGTLVRRITASLTKFLQYSQGGNFTNEDQQHFREVKTKKVRNISYAS